MNRDITFRQAAFIVLIFAAVQFLIQVGLLTRGIAYAAGSLVIDDAYYYLQTAWNAKLLGFVTFDGLHPTNGVQFLWFVIIYLLALISKTKAALLFTTLAVSFLFNGFCYYFIFKIGAILKQPVVALFMASLWALQSLPFRIYSMGMENSLHALVFWLVVWQSLVFLIRVENKDQPNFWDLTVVLVLLVWTRLDSALVAAVLFTFCVGVLAYSYRHHLKLFLQTYSKDIVGSGILAGTGLIAQLVGFRLMGDSFLPVSAMVKTSGAARGLSAESVNKFVDVLLLGMPSIVQGRLPEFVLILLGFAGILIVIGVSATIPNSSKERSTFIKLWSCLLVGELLYHTFVSVSGVEYTSYFIWYRSPSFIFWILTGSLIATFTFEYAKRIQPSYQRFPWVPVASSLFIFNVAVYMFVRSIDFRSKLYDARYNAALWIAENSAPDTVFAAWNTGELSFFSNRTFINLDGVINNADYYERFLSGSIPLMDYLSENEVDYIVDYQIYDSIPDFPVIRTFPIEDGSGRSIQIWQVNPHISSN